MPFYPPHYKVFYSAAKKKNKDNKLFDSKNRNYITLHYITLFHQKAYYNKFLIKVQFGN